MGRKPKQHPPLSDFEREFLAGLREGKDLNTLFAPMMKRVMEVALEEEANHFLDQQSHTIHDDTCFENA